MFVKHIYAPALVIKIEVFNDCRTCTSRGMDLNTKSNQKSDVQV